MRVLVTGSSGAFAAEVIASICSRRHSARIEGCDFFAPYSLATVPPYTGVRSLHLQNFEEFDSELLQRFEEVICCSSLPSTEVSDPHSQLRFIRECFRVGVKRVTAFMESEEESDSSSESNTSHPPEESSEEASSASARKAFNDFAIEEPERFLLIRLPTLYGVSRSLRLDVALNEQCYLKVLGISRQQEAPANARLMSYSLAAKKFVDVWMSRRSGGDFDLATRAAAMPKDHASTLEQVFEVGAEGSNSEIVRELRGVRATIQSLVPRVLLFPGILHRRWFFESLDRASLASRRPLFSGGPLFSIKEVQLNSEDLINQALVALSQGDPEVARVLLRAAALHHGMALDLFHTLAMTYLSEGYERAAALALQEELALFPNNVEARKLLSELPSIDVLH